MSKTRRQKTEHKLRNTVENLKGQLAERDKVQAAHKQQIKDLKKEVKTLKDKLPPEEMVDPPLPEDVAPATDTP